MSLEDLSKAIDAASVTAEGKPVTAAEAPKEFSVTTETGQVYKGKTQEEVLQQLVKAQTHATKTIAQQKRDMEELQAKLAAQVQAPTKPAVVAGQRMTQEQKKQYYELLESDPVEASMYLDSFRQDYQFIYNTAQYVELARQTSQFETTHPEFPNNDPTAVEALQGRMKDKPWNYENLVVAADSLYRDGTIKPAQSRSEEVTLTTPAPAPVLGGSGASPSFDVVDQFAKLPLDQMEKLAREKGWLK
jgi:hypothetical protein